jgi:hypothetical protein
MDVDVEHYTCIYLPKPNTSSLIYAHIYINMYMYLYIYVCMYINMYMYIYIPWFIYKRAKETILLRAHKRLIMFTMILSCFYYLSNKGNLLHFKILCYFGAE